MAEISKAKGIPVIIGVLAGLGCLGLGAIGLGFIGAIALPSFVNRTSKATEVQVKVFVMSLVRAEQAYFLEKGRFTDSISTISTLGSLLILSIYPSRFF